MEQNVQGKDRLRLSLPRLLILSFNHSVHFMKYFPKISEYRECTSWPLGSESWSFDLTTKS
ncbi:hypothetical protein BABINDRAFT_126202 [Babjeviella inositovora NRRL Y-12698]|uniref:Uncharacterized protein n=1 Tax=Babjeviella inositovora NRRL Y-12698 TaxID=984486 RepID=A0A1E3QT71_9ASCO|nr:uncharacterized protein BABINDRAFT_126202 [Babjeviella inositovora NRRL Y-12698]ODQ80704.1 hypothetical protein BABINDRAFT_126202 [Babjeviella inositovora NRRL Y-12698]